MAERKASTRKIWRGRGSVSPIEYGGCWYTPASMIKIFYTDGLNGIQYKYILF